MLNKNFTPFPVLITERLTLRQLSINDAQGIFTLRSDKEISKYLGRQVSETIEDVENFINKISESTKKNESIYWVITITNSGTFVGTICLFNFSNEYDKCEIGYELLTDFQGQGIMKEAAEKVIDFAFNIIEIKKIEAFTHNGNTNSTNLLKKLNFKKSEETDEENPELNIFNLTNPFENM